MPAFAGIFIHATLFSRVVQSGSQALIRAHS